MVLRPERQERDFALSGLTACACVAAFFKVVGDWGSGRG